MTAGGAKSLVDGRRLKALANLTKNRSPIMPELPTAHEQGVNDFEANFWLAIFLPKGTPDLIVHRLNAAAVAAMMTPTVQQRMTELGAELAAPERPSPEVVCTENPIRIYRLIESAKLAR